MPFFRRAHGYGYDYADGGTKAGLRWAGTSEHS
jgi:hypothetical protein